MARRETEMMTGEELRERTRKRRRLLLILVGLVLLCVTIGFAARPTRNAVKSWQARRHAQKAFTLIDQEKWQEAKDEAVAAYQLRPSEPEALRAVARFLSRTRQPQALEFWDQLAKTSKLNRDDLRDEAAAALAVGDAKRAQQPVDELTAASDATGHDWLLAAQLRLQQGTPEKALDSVAKVFLHQGATPHEEFQASLLQLQAAHTGNADVDQHAQSEAWRRLNQLAAGNDAVALDSLVILAQRQLAFSAKAESGNMKSETSQTTNSESSLAANSAPVSESQLSDFSFLKPDELIHRLETHPLSKAPQKLLATDLQIQSAPAEKDALIPRAIDQWKDGDTDSVVTLARWLNGKGEYQLQLDTIPLERAAQNRELFLQHLDALGALGRWEEINRLLETEHYPLDPVIQHMYLARSNVQLGQPEAAKNEWQRALEATGGDVGKLMSLAEYAEKNGASETAEAAYTRAADTAPKARAAWQGRLRLAQAAKDTRRMHEILAKMLELWPNEPAIQNDEAYTRLLLLGSAEHGAQSSDNTEAATQKSETDELLEIEKVAHALVEREPKSLPHRTLLALALLRQHRAVAALQVYDGIAIATNAVTPSALAVHAAVLAANGNHDVAREEITHVPTDSLLPEERAGTADLRGDLGQNVQNRRDD